MEKYLTKMYQLHFIFKSALSQSPWAAKKIVDFLQTPFDILKQVNLEKHDKIGFT